MDRLRTLVKPNYPLLYFPTLEVRTGDLLGALDPVSKEFLALAYQFQRTLA